MKNIQFNLRLLPEANEDHNKVEQLLDLVFTPKRKLLSSYQLRGPANKVNTLSYVIKDPANSTVGSIRFWNIRIDEQSSRGLLLGPLAIHPIYQSEGLGEKLVLNSIEKAAAHNWNWVILVGDIDYYSKFGFSKKPTRGISFGNGLDDARLLGLDINGSFLNEANGILTKAN